MRRLLPIETETDGGEAGVASVRARAAGRGETLAGSFSAFAQREAIAIGDDDDDDNFSLGGGRARRGGKGSSIGGRGGRGGGGRGGRGGRRGGRGEGASDRGEIEQAPPMRIGRGSGWGVSKVADAPGGVGSRADGGGARRRRGASPTREDEDAEEEEEDAEGLFDEMIGSMEGVHDVDDDKLNEAFAGLTMREVRGLVVDAQSVFPMRIPKPKGLAKLLKPEEASAPPSYDHAYPWNLQPFDFAPADLDLRAGRHRASMVDRLLSTHETDAATVLPSLPPLSSVEAWMEALQLPEDARMRRNPRFVRVLEEFSNPSKYDERQKRKMLYALKFGLACDPERAGYEGGVLPFEVPGFDPSEMDAYRAKGKKI
jgi:hypothetical protein